MFQSAKLKSRNCSQYPGWFNFPVDVVVGGAGQDQVENQSQKSKKEANKDTNKQTKQIEK